MKKLRYTIAALLLLICVWFLLPLLKGITHIGMFYPVVLLIPLIAVFLRPQLLKGGQRKRRIFIALGICYLFVAFCCGGTLALMARAAHSEAPENATVVVLGCMVYDSGPSRMLVDRCDAAYEYLVSHPDACCIATGGQGKNEPMSEAEAIFDVLTAKGIDPQRIYLEDRSTDTEENLRNAAALIEEKGLSSEVVVATDGFHEFRAGIYAERVGLVPYAIPSDTYLYVLPGYWAREILAVWKAFLF